MTTRRKLNVNDVLIASKCFKSRTGLGGDDFHPRWFFLLPEYMRGQVAEFLNELEVIGCWPAQLQTTLIKLIPKAKGGKRPIGLLTALVRLWERLRIHEVRNWKAVSSRDYNWAARGRSAQDVVWKSRACSARQPPQSSTKHWRSCSI